MRVAGVKLHRFPLSNLACRNFVRIDYTSDRVWSSNPTRHLAAFEPSRVLNNLSGRLAIFRRVHRVRRQVTVSLLKDDVMDPMKLLGSLMGSNATGGNLLGSLLGGGGGATGGGGAAGMLGSLLGGGGRGGAAGMLGSLLGGGAAAGGIGSMLGGLLGGGGAPEAAAAPKAQAAAPSADQATLMIRAMCNAAKADGQVDDQEQANIIGKLGDDVGEAEINFLKQELAAPLDVAGFARSVPADMAQDIYALSCMTVKVDTPQEAQYLQQLGQGLNLDGATLGAIHQQLGLS
jgi:uncharacterized membrane protein YebE (DUF533 family)